MNTEQLGRLIATALEEKLPEGYWPYKRMGLSEDGKLAELHVEQEVDGEPELVFTITVEVLP